MNESALYDTLLAAEQQRKWPPIADWHPEEIEPGEMYIDAAGTWFHDDVRITRESLVKLFASILSRDKQDQQYYLLTPHNKTRVIVEDVPFLIVDFCVKDQATDQDVLMISNLGDAVPVDAVHPLRMKRYGADQVPYIRMRGGLLARMNRSSYYRLAALMESNLEAEKRFGIWGGGIFHSLEK